MAMLKINAMPVSSPLLRARQLDEPLWLAVVELLIVSAAERNAVSNTACYRRFSG
jgi:hypothetical protein